MELPPDEVTVPPRVGHTATVLAVIFSPDSSLVVSGSSDTTIRIWRLETSEMLRALVGHTNAVEALAMAPDTATLASGSWDMSVMIWRTHTGERLHHARGALELGPVPRLLRGRRPARLRLARQDGARVGPALGPAARRRRRRLRRVRQSSRSPPTARSLVSGYSDEADPDMVHGGGPHGWGDRR